MGQQCWRYQPDHYRPPQGNYFELEETAGVEKNSIQTRHYIFRMQVCVEKAKLRDLYKVNRIRFFITYGDTLVKDWREDIKQCFGDEFISKNAYVAFNQKEANMPIKVAVQTYDAKSNIVEGIQEDFSFLKAAVSGGTSVKSSYNKDSPVKICMIETALTEEEKDVTKYHSYQLEIEYNPEHIPCDDIETVKYPVWHKNR